MAVTANQTFRARNFGNLVPVPVGASKHIYQSTMAFIDAATGLLTDVINSGANKFAGIAKDDYDNSSGAASAITGEVYTEGEFELVGSGFAQTDVGKKIYATDNYAIHLTGTNRTLIGTVVEFISSTKLMVKIDTQLP